MRKALIFFLVLIGSAGSIYSQTLDPSITDTSIRETPLQIVGLQENKSAAYTNSPYYKNNVKINLSSLLLNNYSFYYERMMTRKFSLSAGYRFMPDSRIGDIRLVDKAIDEYFPEEDLDDFSVKDGRMKNSAITLEARYYLGKKPGARGFYVSAMGRYNNFKMELPYSYSLDGTSENIPMAPSFTSFTGGLGLGAQWRLGSRLVLDLYIVGASYGGMNGKLRSNYNFSEFSEDEKQEFISTLEENLDFNNNRYLEADISNNSFSGKLNGPIVGLRGLGLSVGVAF